MKSQQFKQARKALNLNQTLIAQALGVTRQTVSKWERDEPPTMALLAVQAMIEKQTTKNHTNKMKTYEIKAIASSFSLDYKGEGLGKDRNFSDNGARENEQFDYLENAISTAESLLPEFDEYTKIQVFASEFEETEDGGLDFIDCDKVWEKSCTGN